MRWIGRLSTFILLQLAFLVVFLAVTGRLPKHELSLLWNAVRTGQSQAETAVEPTAAEPEETPSFEQLLRARTLESREIDQKRKEAESLIQLAEARLADIDSRQKALDKARTELKQEVKTKTELIAKAGEKKVLEFLETMPPAQAKTFLLDLQEEDEVIGYLKQLDPSRAKKVFKEFQQPQELKKLSGWLARLGKGEPEISKLTEAEPQSAAP
jgi:hypothetical protein